MILASISSVLGTVWWSALMVVAGFAVAKIGVVDWAIGLLPWKRDK
jgi:hypothetical protein